MPRLNKTGTKLLKTLHCMAAGCWIGGGVALVVINLHNPSATLDGMLFGMNTASALADRWVVIIPGAMACLATGLIYSLFTGWGFLKHRWVLCKWLLAILCTLVGAVWLGAWEEEMLELSEHLGNAALFDSAYQTVKTKHLLVSAAQILVLLLMVGISVFKPWSRKAAA